jgi:hydroxyacylglutathione hydrolase
MKNTYGDKITAELYRVAWWDITAKDYVNCDVYAVDCGDSVVLIDSGRGGPSYPQIKENLVHWGLWDRVSICLLTHMHRDHAGAVMDLRSDGIKVWGGQGYIQYLKNEKASEYWNNDIPVIDDILNDGEKFKIGNVDFEVVFTPGHTSICTTYLASAPNKRYAFTGDLFMPNGTIGYSGSFDFNCDCLLSSLKHLLQYDFDAALTGHYLQASQPEGFWLENGKKHVRITYQSGLEGKWNIQKP